MATKILDCRLAYERRITFAGGVSGTGADGSFKETPRI
jgi:hypothetical protein